MFSKFWQKIFPPAESSANYSDQSVKEATEISHPEAVVSNNPKNSDDHDYSLGNQLSSESEINFSESKEEPGNPSAPLESDDLEIKL